MEVALQFEKRLLFPLLVGTRSNARSPAFYP